MEKKHRQFIKGIVSHVSTARKENKYNTNTAFLKIQDRIKIKKIELMISSGYIDIFTRSTAKIVNVDITQSENWIVLNRSLNQKYIGADISYNFELFGNTEIRKIGKIKSIKGKQVLVYTKNVEDFIILTGKRINLDIMYEKNIMVPQNPEFDKTYPIKFSPNIELTKREVFTVKRSTESPNSRVYCTVFYLR